jgi:regulator of sigma E protease
MLDTREGPLTDAEAVQAFDRQSLFARSCIILAGPVANLVLAVLLFAAASWWGLEEPEAVLAQPAAGSLVSRAGLVAGDRVLAVSKVEGVWTEVETLSAVQDAVQQAARAGADLQLQVSDGQGQHRRTLELPLREFADSPFEEATWQRIGIGAPFSAPMIGEVKPGGPAAAAGLQKGDRVMRIEGDAVADAASLRARIRASAASPSPGMEWEVERNGASLTLQMTPRVEIDRDGKSVGRVDAMVGAPPSLRVVRRGPLEGLQLGLARTGEVAWMSLRTMGQMLIGQASLRNLSGPLTIADYAGQSVERGLAYYLGFLGLVSVSLGVLNLLPLPLLDGGHLIYYFFEGLTGRPVSGLWLAWLQRGGALVLLLIMSLALSNDVARLLGLQ